MAWIAFLLPILLLLGLWVYGKHEGGEIDGAQWIRLLKKEKRK